MLCWNLCGMCQPDMTQLCFGGSLAGKRTTLSMKFSMFGSSLIGSPPQQTVAQEGLPAHQQTRAPTSTPAPASHGSRCGWSPGSRCSQLLAAGLRARDEPQRCGSPLPSSRRRAREDLVSRESRWPSSTPWGLQRKRLAKYVRNRCAKRLAHRNSPRAHVVGVLRLVEDLPVDLTDVECLLDREERLTTR